MCLLIIRGNLRFITAVVTMCGLKSPNIPLTDWLDNDQGSREWLEKLLKQLNSAEDLDATEGEFYVEMTFIKNSGCGGKNGWKKGNPGRMSY